MPSSTSNSEHENSAVRYREIPTQPWVNATFVAALIVVAAIIAWEALARSMHHIPGTYQSGFKEMWAEERKKLDAPNDIRIVITGSSRILWATDLDIMQQQFGTRPIQLALPGTSPAIFVEDVVNNTDFDGLVLVGITPFLVNWIGPGYFGGPALDFYKEPSPSDISGFYLHDFLSEYLAFLDEAFSLPELKDHYIQLPQREGAKVLNQQGWKLGDVFADRQTDMWPPVEQVGSFDNQQVINFWTRGIDLDKPVPEEKRQEMNQGLIDFFRPLVEKQRQKGGDIVFIRMPSSGDYLRKELLNDYTEKFWKPVMSELNAPYLDSFDHPELSTDLEIPEWSHLSRQSQDDWSERVPAHIERVYQTVREKPLKTIIGPDRKKDDTL
ncbi:hypothetical protein [Lacimicrobium sp. SS2-24]|uniref:hypothetical protein n=1 Tax=Lacimicrobium sp. SS2-24 TaxID=2005569 RepID=UPI000B4B64A8|nr:hypothetical protein [Lacimicrobium sp. SS2-24]